MRAPSWSPSSATTAPTSAASRSTAPTSSTTPTSRPRCSRSPASSSSTRPSRRRRIRSARGSIASPASSRRSATITVTPRSSFDDHQGRVFRLIDHCSRRAHRRRRTRPRCSNTRTSRRCSPIRPDASFGDSAIEDVEDVDARRRAWMGAIRLRVQRPGCRRGDERDLAVGVNGTAYERAVATLDAVAWRGIMPGLERTRALLAALGNPQTGLRGALVAGTNGKGSVCATVDAVCRAAGHRSVLLTSPHLQSVHRAHRSRRRADHRDRVRGADRHRP